MKPYDRLKEALRVLRYERRERKYALMAAGCFATIPLVKQLSLGSVESVVTWGAAGAGVFLSFRNRSGARAAFAPAQPRCE